MTCLLLCYNTFGTYFTVKHRFTLNIENIRTSVSPKINENKTNTLTLVKIIKMRPRFCISGFTVYSFLVTVFYHFFINYSSVESLNQNFQMTIRTKLICLCYSIICNIFMVLGCFYKHNFLFA